MNTAINLKATTLTTPSPLFVLLTLICAALFAAPANAHEVFTETIEADYGLKAVTCKACHPVNDDRSIRNEFGRLVAQAVAGKDITARMAVAEAAKAAAANEEEGEAILAEEEAKVAADLRDVLPQIEAAQFTVKQMLDTGLLNGAKLTDETEVALQERYAEMDAAAEGNGATDGGEARDGAEPEGRNRTDGGVSATIPSDDQLTVRTDSSFLWMIGGLVLGAGAFGLTMMFRR